jgi:hypothetical protein
MKSKLHNEKNFVNQGAIFSRLLRECFSVDPTKSGPYFIASLVYDERRSGSNGIAAYGRSKSIRPPRR